MPRRCTVCDHDEQHAINVALVHREPYLAISRTYEVSRDALRNHARDHLPDLLVEPKRAVEAARGDDLVGELAAEKADIQRLKKKAEEEDDIRVALHGCDKALKALELQARVSQLIDERPRVNILIAPVVRDAIVQALTPYPEARLAVANALEPLEDAS